jgi:hypothetical protein
VASDLSDKPVGLLLLRDEAFTQVAWTSEGAVVALSRRRFWWFRPGGERIAQTTLIADGKDSKFALAAKANVAVVSAHGQAHVFYGPTKVRSFALREGEHATTLSDDGTILATSNSLFGYEVGHTYEIATGKRLADFDSLVILSPGQADWVLGARGVRSTRDGAAVVTFDTHTILGGAWVDGLAVGWTQSGLLVADPVQRKQQTVPARCVRSERDEVFEWVDRLGKQAVRFCGSRLLVVRVNDRSVYSIPIPPSRTSARPQLRLARGGDAIMLDWGKDDVDQVDLKARSLRHIAIVPPTRNADGAAPWDEPTPSPDGRLLLVAQRSANEGLPLRVLSRESKQDLVSWGLPSTPQGEQALAAFLHERGLDIYTHVAGQLQRVRIGPAVPPLTQLPPLEPHGACPETSAGEATPNRILNGQEAIYQWVSGKSCVCRSEGCVANTFPPLVLHARQDHRLLMTARANDGEASYLEGLTTRGTSRFLGSMWGGAFLDEGKAVAMLLAGNALSDVFMLRESTLPDFAVRRLWEVPRHTMAGHRPTVIGTARSIVVASSDLSELKASVVTRAVQGSKPTEIDAWIGGGVVSLPDGRFELFGSNGEQAIACLEPATGRVRPFATCRDQYEAKGAFRIE